MSQNEGKDCLNGLKENAAVQEITQKQADRYALLFRICLVLFFIGVIGTVYLWFQMRDQDLEGIEAVEVTVTDMSETDVRISGHKNTSYQITVLYKGKEYQLIDGDYLWAKIGRSGIAYRYNGRIYANENGPQARTGIGRVYSVFLISTFVLLLVTPCVGSKAKQMREKHL
ncbi:MAG: hypothetical protein IJ794_10115 [Lachnospiraceae bacterium]|nr:hypothetical protein [Lachnospiraceae bacterium]